MIDTLDVRTPRAGVLAALLLATLPTAEVRAEPGVSWDLPEAGTPVELDARERGFDAGAVGDDEIVRVAMRYEVHLSADAVDVHARWVDYYATADAAQSYPREQVGWDSGSEQLAFREAAVLRGDGSVSRFDPATVQIIDTDSYDVFSDVRQVILVLPGLTADSYSIMETEHRSLRADLDAPWQWIDFVQSTLPTREYAIEVTWDADVAAPAWHQVGGLLDCAVTERRLSCIGRDLPALPLDNNVDYADVRAQLVVADPVSWDDVAGLTLAGVAEAAGDGRAAAALHARITDGLEDPAVRILALHSFAARDVRYHSASEGRHSIVPHPVADTIENRYGDCKDKSALLWSLLRAEGVEAWPTLVATRRSDPSRLAVPGVGWFDHMVVCLESPAGTGLHCLDPTDAHTSPDVVPGWIQGRASLISRPGASVDVVPPQRFRWVLETETTLAFDAEGHQTDETTVRYLGAWAGALRSELTGRAPDERRRFLADRYRAVVSDIVDPDVSWRGQSDIEVPIELAYAARFEDLVQPGEPMYYVEPSSWMNDLLESADSENEYYDYRFPGIAMRQTYHFDVGPGWSLDGGGPDLDLEHRFGLLRRRHETDGSVLSVTTELELPARLIPLEDLEAFNRLVTVFTRETSMAVRASPK